MKKESVEINSYIFPSTGLLLLFYRNEFDKISMFKNSNLYSKEVIKMKKTWKVMLTFLVALVLLFSLASCGGKDDEAGKDGTMLEAEGTTLEEGNPDYNVEEDLVEGILTEDMLDQMDEEEATTEEEKKDEEKKEDKKDPTANLNKYYIKVNRRTNVITVYTYDEQGKYTKPVKAFVCSVGKSSSPTPTGKFKISTKHRWQLMKGDVYSQYCSRITGHILFHSVPYRETKSNTLFASYYDRLGNAASSGCVRMTCGDALWIYSNCPSGTVVEIFDGSSANDPLGKPSAMKVSGTAYSTWDPTDPVSNNPWKTAKPIITVSSFDVELGSEKVDLASKATVKDAYGNSLKPEVSGNVDTTKAGTYSITYTAKDSRGNSAKATITVTVKDTKGPEIITDLNGKKYNGELTEAAVAAYVKEHTTLKDASGKAAISDISVSINETAGKIDCVITAEDGSHNLSNLSLQMTFDVKVPDEPSTDEPSTEKPPVDEPSTQPPATDEPATDEPATEPPATDEPATEGTTSTEAIVPTDMDETLEEDTSVE